MNFDYNNIPFGEQNNFVNTVIEIPKGSTLKIEWRKDKGIFELDRIEPKIFAKPCSYGFIPNTLDEDGDELDILMIAEEPLPMGLVIITKVVGVLNFRDDDENDHKIIGVPVDNRNNGNSIQSLNDLTDAWKNQITHHFNHYKDLKKPGSTEVKGFEDIEKAWQTIKECHERYVNNASAK